MPPLVALSLQCRPSPILTRIPIRVSGTAIVHKVSHTIDESYSHHVTRLYHNTRIMHPRSFAHHTHQLFTFTHGVATVLTISYRVLLNGCFDCMYL